MLFSCRQCVQVHWVMLKVTQCELHTGKVAGAKMQVQNWWKAMETHIFMPGCLVKKRES